MGREPPGERKVTSLRDPRCTSLGTAVRPQVWECRVHLPQGSGDILSPPHGSPGLLQEPPASSCPCSHCHVLPPHSGSKPSPSSDAQGPAQPAPAGLTSCCLPSLTLPSTVALLAVPWTLRLPPACGHQNSLPLQPSVPLANALISLYLVSSGMSASTGRNLSAHLWVPSSYIGPGA